ncbi:hypothetical protein TNCV_3352621 [Trichonephila clavipes]|nr:hypothetical protein TNCV_3352621 [Trichonephila clavipes]
MGTPTARNVAPAGSEYAETVRSNHCNNMLTKYQMVQFIDFCEVWFLPESVARVAAIAGDNCCHTPRH